MPSLRYLKFKLYRVIYGKSFLLMVPIMWICVLLWSARTADHSMRANINHRFAEEFLDPSVHHRSKTGKRSNDKFIPATQRAMPKGSLQQRHDGQVKHDSSDKQNKESKTINLVERIGFHVGAKKRKQNKNQDNTINSKRKKKTEQPVRKGDHEKDQNQPKLDRLGGALFKTHSSAKHHQQAPTNLLVRNVDYKEVLWLSVPPDRQPILPGKRSYAPLLGEGGQPVEIVESTLSSEERKKWDTGWENHKFNEYVSDKISIEREVPDYRPYQCLEKHISPDLPRASIIICFYNEAWSVLLRTIHSVFRKSPPELIREIILVDDFSDMASMKSPLEKYAATVPKLRLLRMTRRSGLVKARLAGIKEALGPVIIFLDSHIECEEGWLPPLLQVISRHRDVAVTPGIDIINHKTFAVEDAVGVIGGMDFDGLVFNWMEALPRMLENTTSPADIIVSPTMAGGLFAINKQFFLDIGTYDPGLELWGGENIELSLKLWMCGGGIFINPCSRVAHIFREVSPYLKGETTNVVIKNSARVAQVWLDEYTKFYFPDKPYDELVYGSVEEQLKLKRSLKCKGFGWYLEHVYPELYIYGTGAFLGKITSSNGLCIHRSGSNKRNPLTLIDCTLAMGWEMTRMKEIRSMTLCFEKSSSVLLAAKCDLKSKKQLFQYNIQDRTIYHPLSQTCLGVTSNRLSPFSFQRCTGSHSQTWDWPYNPNYVPYHQSKHR
ncbi:polypeptide n-acetylgalactosaminyltransferase [Plakobranchus ocellatus]|uniref:Polypeptide N-acetylgalactosaminyltransferase n=1 Tax=Plakobranchus ocellatus TaxID=259542 RepID=A0AAV4BI41_9GAST|nr:polypeptide n-acetylgalactosaminyltransferase [Plakobranchus ocellatus]